MIIHAVQCNQSILHNPLPSYFIWYMITISSFSFSSRSKKIQYTTHWNVVSNAATIIIYKYFDFQAWNECKAPGKAPLPVGRCCRRLYCTRWRYLYSVWGKHNTFLSEMSRSYLNITINIQYFSIINFSFLHNFSGDPDITVLLKPTPQHIVNTVFMDEEVGKITNSLTEPNELSTG